MNKKRIGIGVGITVLAALTVQAASPVVSNIRASQRTGTKLIDIWYDVSDSDGDTVTVSATVKNGESAVPASSFTGQIGYNISCGINKKITWDAGADWSGNISTLTITVMADDGPACPVAKTGQTTSYKTGDDGDLEPGVVWPNPRFTDSGDGTVKDNLTGLEWVKAPHLLSGNSGATNWNAAVDFCNNLVYAGHSDWRLPSIKEMESLVDFGKFYWAVPAGHPFVGMQNVSYWSGTSCAGGYWYMAWRVYLTIGTVSSGDKTDSLCVWPVRGGQASVSASPVPKTGQTAMRRTGDDGDLETGVAWAEPRFADSGDGTVKDNLTGLEWVKAPHSLSGNSTYTNWNSAIDFCNNLVYSGHSDWRMPSLKELMSLANYGLHSPALPTGNPFVGVQGTFQSGFYWVGTSFAPIPANAWVVYMGSGSTSPNREKSNNYGCVWPVRDASVGGGYSSATGNVTVDTRDSVLSVSIDVQTSLLGWYAGNSISFEAVATNASGSVSYAWDLDGDKAYDDAFSKNVSTSFVEGVHSVHLVSVQIVAGSETARASVFVPIGKPPVLNETTVKPTPDPLFGHVLKADGVSEFSFDPTKKVNGLVLIIHGLNNSATNSWVTNMAAKVKERLTREGKGEPNICLYDWKDWANPSKLNGLCDGMYVLSESAGVACTVSDFIADVGLIKPSGIAQGNLLAHWLHQRINAGDIDPNAPIHLIGHSAGGFVVGEAGYWLTQPLSIIYHPLSDIQVTLLDTPLPVLRHISDYPNPHYLDRIVSSVFGAFPPQAFNNSYYQRIDRCRNGQRLIESWDTTYDHQYAYNWYTDTIQSNSPEGFSCSPLLDYGFYGYDRSPAQAVMAESMMLAEARSEESTSAGGTTNYSATGFSTFGGVKASGSAYTLTESANAGIYLTMDFPQHARSLRFQYQFTSPGDGDFLSVHVGSNRTVYVGADTELSRGCFLDAEADVREFSATTNQVTFKLVSRGSPNAVLVVKNVELICALDSDGDGLADDVESNSGYFISEYDTGTDPSLSDTDLDGVNDGAEVSAGTDPVSFKASKGTYTDKVCITWDAQDVPRDVPNYGVYRATTSFRDGFPDSLEELSITTALSYDDTSAVPGKIYYYTIWSEEYQLMGEALGFRRVSGPDLVIENASYVAGTYNVGDMLSITAAKANRGSVEAPASPSFLIEGILSPSTNWNDPSKIVGFSNIENEGLGVDEVRMSTVPVTVESTWLAGSYYFGIKIDVNNSVNEGLEDNNIWWSSAADIVIAPQNYLLTVNGGGGGGLYTNGARVIIIASNAPSGQMFNQWTGMVQHVTSVASATTTVTMPTSNITIVATYRNAPDLLITNVVYSTNIYLLGETLGVSLTETNAGLAAASSFSVVGVLSTNGVWSNANNIVLGTNVTATGLAAGAGYATNFAYTIPLTVPPAHYYLGLMIDSTNGITESCETNNVWWSSYDSIRITNDLRLTVSNGTGSGVYKAGSNVTIAAVLPAGKMFDRWIGPTEHIISVTSSPIVLVMPTSNITVTATFKDIQYTLTVTNGSGSATTYTNQQRVTIIANPPATGKEFDRWTGATQHVASVISATTVVTMPPANIAVTATYRDIHYTLTVSGGTGGNTIYINGQQVTITANPPSAGKEFARWTGATQYVASVISSTTKVTMPAQDIEIEAVYKPILNTSAWAVFEFSLSGTGLNRSGGKDGKTPVLQRASQRALLVINTDTMEDTNAVFVVMAREQYTAESAVTVYDPQFAWVSEKEDQNGNITAESCIAALSFLTDSSGNIVMTGPMKWNGKYDRDGSSLVSEKSSISLRGAAVDGMGRKYATGSARYNQLLSDRMTAAEKTEDAAKVLNDYVAGRTKASGVNIDLLRIVD